MAKARFPGKPSKLTPNSRIRVSVKSVDAKSDLANQTVQQISLGFQLFHSLFEQNPEDQDFYGFVSQGHARRSETRRSTAKEESHVERDKLPRPSNVAVENHTSCIESPTLSQPSPASCQRVQAVASKIQSQNHEESTEIKVPVGQNEEHKGTRKGKKTGEKSPRKFILPSRSAHSSRPIIPNKRFLEELSQVEPKKSHVVVEEKDDAKDATSAGQEKLKSAEDDTKLEKDKIKKEIARYTDIMMTERQADERRRLKEEKMRGKIQQLLRSQWESRLSGDGNQRGDSAAGRASSMSVSSEDDSPSCSSANKVILREPRLQLSQRLLRQLRKPSQPPPSAGVLKDAEVGTASFLSESDSTDNPCPSPSILRPPQLIVQTPPRILQTQDLVRTSSPSLSNSDSRLSPAGLLMERTGMNPLGCAFVADTDHGEEKRIPGTVVCGVCGVVRKYSFILQARKFGTFSCEPCRKFISRVLRNRTRVKCWSQSGRCINAPVSGCTLFEQTEDGPSAVNEPANSRCDACRLKLALTGFRMKDADHDELRKLLPLEMQSMVPVAAERHTVFSSAPNRGQIVKVPPNFLFAAEVGENPAAERIPTVTSKGSRANVIRERLDGGWGKKYVQHDNNWSVYVISPSGEKFRNAGELQRHRELGVQLDPRCFNFDPPGFSSQENVGRVLAEHCAGSRAPRTRTRTEAEVRGPRVKNVCRSAMVALGQPKALFDGRQQQQQPPPPQQQRLTTQEVQLCTDPVCVGCSQSKTDSACLTSPSATVAANNLQSLSAKSLSIPKNSDSSLVRPTNIKEGEQGWTAVDSRLLSIQQVASSAVRAYQSQKEFSSSLGHPSALGAKKFSRSNSGTETNPLLSISFWESFDLHRLWEEGFPVLGAALGVAQLCYLCGSAGKEELVNCAGCCESFHPYCVTSSPLVRLKSSLEEGEKLSSIEQHEDSIGLSSEEGKAIDICPSSQVWFCKRCQPCRVCRSSRDFKLSCSLCNESYHSLCLPPAFPHPHPGVKEAWSCSACSRCRNCRKTGTFKSVGPYLYCEKCHVEDVQDKVCPLCMSSCGQNDDWLLECSICCRWIHMKCQNFTEEDYHLLARGDQNRFVCERCVDGEGCHDLVRRLLHETCSSLLSKLASTRLLRRGFPEFQAKLARLQERVDQGSFKTSLEFWHDLEEELESFQVKSTLKELHHRNFPWSFSTERETTASKTDRLDPELKLDCVVGYQAEADWRGCLLCKRKGEGDVSAEGRLLHCGNNEWIHINCILWSNEVFESPDGGLQNVYAALNRGRVTRCSYCHHKGATLSCCVKSCAAAYHFSCAVKSDVFLEEDKNIFCREHEPCLPRRKQTRFDVQRWVYVDLHEEMRRMKALPPKCVQLVIGSLKIQSIGELMSDVTASKAALYPANFRCERVFWSVKEPWKRTTYTICTKFVPGHCDTSEQDVNVTVSHEDEDVIMAESGLNIPEMETQEDSELIHMVLEDADFEQELVRGTTSGRSPPPEVRDSGFYSDAQSETSPCPVEQETNQSLEAWLADPEHAVILLDSALLATLDTMETNPLSEASSIDTPAPSCSETGNEAEEIAPTDQEPDSSSKRARSNRRVSYSQWKKLRLENHRTKAMSTNRTALDWNGNEQQWNPGASSLLASIKVSPLVQVDALEPVPRPRNSNILQLDGAADSSEAESDVPTAPLTSSTTDEEPVKCSRCKRCYRTLQSFNKHAQTCDEVLSSSTSDEEAEEIPVVKKEVEAVTETNPIQVPIVNSSSQVTSTSSVEENRVATPAVVKTCKPRSRRKPKVSPSTVRRPIAARVPFVPNGIQVVAPQPPPQVRTFHITIPQPIQAPTPQPQQHVVYVSNNMTSAELQQFPLAQSQPHVFVIPPVEPTILHASQLQSSTTLYGTSPLVQYYGSYPSELLTLGPMNMGLTPFPALVPGMTAVQCHLPWEAANVGPVIMLPPPQQQQQQQHQPSPQSHHLPAYPIINTILPMEQPNIIPVQPNPPEEVTPCVVNIEPEPVLDVPHSDPLPQFEAVSHVEAPAAEQHGEETVLEPETPLPETTVAYDALEEVDGDRQAAADFVDEFHSDIGQPPRPTYSYRMAMNGGKKNPLTAALIAAAITTADLEPSEEPSPPFGTQQLKVTAESSESQRTFRIKATSTSEVPRGPHIVYELTSEDGFRASSASITDLWRQLLNAVQDARLAYKLEPLPDAVFPSEESDSLKVLGLNHPALRYLLEQLPNASSCANYEFLYHQPEPLASLTGSAFGCARTAPYSGRLPHDIFNWLASEHRSRPQLEFCNGSETQNGSTGRRATNFELLPMSARFRNLRQTSRYSVGVFRSGIHGRGLFCKRDFEAGEMVVEYAGEIIRSIVSDKREKEYEAKGIGCYMFRIDDQTVVDATMHGNSARFINHSCEPNCYSRIVDVLGKKQIVIFALRRIQRGEELTYDYKFPIEDVKIPCTCGSRRCRKYLN